MDAQHLPPSERTEAQRAGVPAEFVFLIVMLCLTMILALAGVPGRAEPEAGNGSETLRRGWAEQRMADAQELPAADETRAENADPRAAGGR